LNGNCINFGQQRTSRNGAAKGGQNALANQTEDVGRAKSMSVTIAPHLNILTGDSGLGKIFLMDITWWALTSTWAGLPAWPEPKKGSHPVIEFTMAEDNEKSTAEFIHRDRCQVLYDFCPLHR
jgi:hypothetical protein